METKEFSTMVPRVYFIAFTLILGWESNEDIDEVIVALAVEYNTRDTPYFKYVEGIATNMGEQ